VRDQSGNLAGSTFAAQDGTYSIAVAPAQYTHCVIIPGGFGVISGSACQPVQFASSTTATLADVTLSTLPLISRNGPGTMSVDFGSRFLDPGATATKDGRDLTAQIVVSGAPDTSVPGLYVMSYAVVDPETKLSATTTRVVQVNPQTRESAGVSQVIGASNANTPASVGAAAIPLTSLATTSSTTLTQSSASSAPRVGADETITVRPHAVKYYRKGSVLGVSTGTNTPAITVSTSAIPSEPIIPNEMRWGYIKAIGALLGFGVAIGGLWWWKKKLPVPHP
jgi:hypothetical protein